MKTDYDILIIGGGINGCGIARDAVGRGYSVYLCETDDLASGTSSQSTKLIHGGLRYLEYYKFRLVRESLVEREILWKIAPHIIRPLRFILPHSKGLRPAWLLRLGLFLYDHIGGRKKLPPTKSIDLSSDETGKPLKLNYSKGFEYSDCAVDDARLVILNAIDAAKRGASINTRSKCVALQRNNNGWDITIENQSDKSQTKITAKMVINASGPWVDRVLSQLHTDKTASSIRMVQGSHIIVPRLYDHDRCYIFQNEDNRIIFAIPYYEKFTLIGTTDQAYQGNPREKKITQEEIKYLCASANNYFKQEIKPVDIVATYCGVRGLYDDGLSEAQEATRDYVLKIDKPDSNMAPMLSIFGGKITSYRKLAETVLEKIEPLLGNKPANNKGKWTESAFLPGGDFKFESLNDLCKSLQKDYEFLSKENARRFIQCYGIRAPIVLNKAKSRHDLGEEFAYGLYQLEVDYLVEHEWALTAEDILWRRTKLGLHFNKTQTEKLEHYLLKISASG